MLVLFSAQSQNCNHDAAAGGTQEPAERVDRQIITIEERDERVDR